MTENAKALASHIENYSESSANWGVDPESLASFLDERGVQASTAPVDMSDRRGMLYVLLGLLSFFLVLPWAAKALFAYMDWVATFFK